MSDRTIDPCTACAGTGLVAPDAFGEWEPWHRYVARIEVLHAEREWPRESNAVAMGMINPMPCPVCTEVPCPR